MASQLIRHAKVKVAVFVDRSQLRGVQPLESPTNLFGPFSGKGPTILVPFFGGPDDRAALLMAMRLSTLPNTVVTILHIRTIYQAENVAPIPSRTATPAVTNLRQRVIGSGRPQPQPVREQRPDIPAGYKVDDVDPEDARIIEMVLNYSGPIQQLASQNATMERGLAPPTATSLAPQPTSPIPSVAQTSGILASPPNSIPFRRIATANSTYDRNESEASGTVGHLTINTSAVSPGTPNTNTLSLRRPSAMDIGGSPFVRVNTTQSQVSVDQPQQQAATTTPHGNTLPSSSNNTSAAAVLQNSSSSSTLATTSGMPDVMRPTIILNEVASADPLGSLIEALQSPEGRMFSLIAFGHFGPTWTQHGDHSQTHATVQAGQSLDHWHEINQHTTATMSGMAALAGASGTVEEKVLGPTGAAIIRTRSGGNSNLLALRKVRLDAKSDL